MRSSEAPGYAAELERRRERRRAARAGRTCGWCGSSLDALPATARWCGVPCRKAAAWRRAHPVPRRRAAERRRPALEPVPALEVHPLVEAALAELRPSERDELGSPWDSGVRDLVSEYVLAAWAGHDPLAALRAARRRVALDRVLLVRGLERVDGLVR